MRITYLILTFVCCIIAKAETFPYRSIASFNISPASESYCMMFDSEGMMWVGTNSGLKSYDGYTVKSYKSNVLSPGILPNNDIRSMAEDHEQNLWLGTRNGLVKINRKTGVFKTYFLPSEDQRIIYHLFVSRDGTLWVGTDGGLSYFNPENESFYTYTSRNAWLINENGKKQRLNSFSVKCVAEDKNGDLLIGTWSSGLMRLKRGSNVFRSYPKLNDRNSAYSLFFDKNHHLWVGTWGYGVLCISNPDNLKNPQYHQYPYATNNFDIFYKFVEDPITNTLWACTREGICYLDEDQPQAGWSKYTQIGNNRLIYCNDISTDGAGNIWLCTQNDGVLQITTPPSLFKQWYLGNLQNAPTINYVNAILTTDGKWFWLGLNPYGIALYNRDTGDTYYNKGIPGFGKLSSYTLTTSITSIVKRSNDEIWFAVNNYGVIIKPKEKEAFCLDNTNTNYIKENFVNAVFESKDKTMWIGSRNGMSIVYPDNTGYFLTMKEGKKDFSSCDIRNICQDRQGNIWVSTDNEGIIRISGNTRNIRSLKYRQYCPKNGKYAINDAQKCMEDNQGRLWAISNSGGLFLYNKVEDRFEYQNRKLHLPDDQTFSIEGDASGNIWVALNKALAYITWKNQESDHLRNITYFTQEDGLGEIKFSADASYQFGKEIFFGTRAGFFSFPPSAMTKMKNHRNCKLVITDLIIDDVPFAQLDSVLKSDISEEMPHYTKRISIPSNVKKFDIEFSLLTYGNTRKNSYAYQLEGYDEDWQYCDKGLHRAAFQNLPSGTYHLRVKATDGYGKWQELPYTISIQVLPPWYASRIAFMLYILMLIGGIFGAARWYKERVKTRNSLQMGVILTNITHELLTPLTVISATIYKLKAMAPQYEEDYLVMDSNINRTTRLLRQILEVRKSQAGQLHLLVSRGNLIFFIEEACENIRPMAEHQQVRLKFNKPYSEGTAWFDADKMDKIIYNLLSNAIKYNKVGGKIDVSLSLSKEQAVITIADNGIGMSKEKMKRLYTRFFDGDYRKQNMPGTGIGLSLTHDLVKLHHGDIRCESLEGEGTIFTITLPIRKNAYAPDEIDVSNKRKAVDQKAIQQASQEVKLEAPNSEEEDKPKLAPVRQSIFIRKNASKILVVEDNEELLALMLQVLSKNYHVFTAKNGKQAMNIIMKEKLDLVVSDVMMPIMDGIELTKQLKSDKSFWQLPIILLTAKNKEEDKTEAYSIGADAYITKPFKFEELEVRINALLANRKKMIEKIESEVSLQANSEAEAQQEVHLSNPEQAFVTRAKETIMQHLSDADYDREAFAKDMAMGESTLYNKVKATTGQTVIAFITSIRMKEAQRIIQSNPNILISDVAIQVGFNTPKYFSKCFKKEFGVFPKEYAEKLKNVN